MATVVLTLSSTNAAAELLQEPQLLSTRFGPLSVGQDRVLLFKARRVQPRVRGNNSLDLGTLYRIGSTDVVLVTDNGGTACPYLYHFVAVATAGAKATPAFAPAVNLHGSCGPATGSSFTSRATAAPSNPNRNGSRQPGRSTCSFTTLVWS